jgi:hypothetical protein
MAVGEAPGAGFEPDLGGLAEAVNARRSVPFVQPSEVIVDETSRADP